MIRALTILATAALALPVGHYIDDALGTGARTLGASVALAAPGVATDKPKPAVLGLVYRDGVTVGKDGNGVRTARFATTLAGRDVGYVLLIENGCAGADPAPRCPAPVSGVTVTLNDDVVFQNDEDFARVRREIALNPGETNDNSLFIAATGSPGSGARVRILAIRQPDKPKPKPAVLGLVYRDGVTVGKDGNGVRTARFATTLAGRDVGYVLLIENGCAGADPAPRCPAPVSGVTVTLNDDVVFQNDEDFARVRREIALNPGETNDNSLFIAATGSPGSGARVRILAIRQPDKPKPKPAVLGLVYRDGVTVGKDGNGVRTARFATTLAGRDVGYVLLIENGCAGADPAPRCPAPVSGVTVTLNDDVVFQNDEDFARVRREIALNPGETNDNSLFIAATGSPGSGARVRILAIRQPDKPKPKPAVLGLVYRDGVTVGKDGNGVRTARFATTLAGRDVGYVLLIENGCAGADPAPRCPAPVSGVTVTLNDDVVFQNDEDFARVRREIALNPGETNDNSLFIAATGSPGSGARVRILAIRREPLDQA